MSRGEEIREEERSRQSHVVVVPLPTQGHINPLLQFAKHLAHRGLTVTFPTIFTNADSSHPPLTTSLTVEQVALQPYEGTEPEDVKSYWGRRDTSISRHLRQLIARHEAAGDSIDCVIYDSIMTWIVDIVKEFGVLGASFFTQSCAVNAIYYHIHKGWLNVPSQQRQSSVSLDGFPLLQMSELPSFVHDLEKYPNVLPLMASQFSRLNEADWIFVNTFDRLEQKEVEWMEGQYPFKNIGPMVPSMLLDDTDYGLSLFEANNVDSTTNWLDSKDKGSVVYVSFGSTAELGREQMEELAWGLRQSNRFFLWVIRESEIEKLPKNLIEEEKGMVVTWCPQLQVLAHKSIGCFVTHCGWNSCLEAVSLGVAMVAMPQWTDQPTNAKYVEDIWKVGRRVRVDENGMAKREEIELCINQVTEGESSEEMRENVRKWKELAKQALEEGGPSDNNINEFVQTLRSHT